MKNFLINKLLAYVGNRLNGVKTYLAGAGFILLALAGCLGKLFPDQGLPDMDWETVGGNFSGGMALLGIGHKLEKAASQSASPGNATGTSGSSDN